MSFMQVQKEKAGKQELKLAVVGSGGVGKSALTIRFVTSHFYDQGYNPTIEDSYRKQVVVNDEAVTLEILDTAGQEEYAAMANQWYKYASGFLLVYSITDRVSFENLLLLHQDILRVKDRSSVPIIVLSNKCDLAQKRAVGQAEGRDLARSFGAPFIECSAAEGVNVDVAFRQLVKLVRKDERRIASQHAQILAGPISGPSIISPSQSTPTLNTISTLTPTSAVTPRPTPSTPSTPQRTLTKRARSPAAPTAQSPQIGRGSPTKDDAYGGEVIPPEKNGCCVVM